MTTCVGTICPLPVTECSKDCSLYEKPICMLYYPKNNPEATCVTKEEEKCPIKKKKRKKKTMTKKRGCGEMSKKMCPDDGLITTAIRRMKMNDLSLINNMMNNDQCNFRQFRTRYPSEYNFYRRNY